ncbi:MAG: hypothetical protein AUI53_02075 [Acidobacteria bacterium 13_1_40CM_2_60_7]|nr:MAG: hypothetical protein AUI53_02075 [Acidobacteria bacterium 13_1_40CM_2_60_7]
MRDSDRRTARRLIKKVPLRFRPVESLAVPEQTAETMNISNGGLFFATDLKLAEGLLVELHLTMPREILGDDLPEWYFMGRVAHVESFGNRNGKSGVGVQFLYYEVPKTAA